MTQEVQVHRDHVERKELMAQWVKKDLGEKRYHSGTDLL